MPTYTREASHTIVLMRVGSSNRAANDAHLTIGKGSGSHSTYIGRAEVRIPEPDWPTRGTLVRATITVQPSGTDTHPHWEGGSPRISIKRMSEKARFGSPADGHGSDDYSTEGEGDKYPGGEVTGTAVEFNVNGRTSRDVTSMVRQMLPARLGGNDELYGYFRIISTDEDSASRSVVLSTKVTLSVEIDTRVVPSVPTILEVVGKVDAPDDPALVDEPTLVATDDGRTLEVRFAFAAGPGETCRSAILELRTPGSEDPTDTTPVTGTVLYTTGDVAPLPGGGTGIYIARLTGIAKGTEGRWRLSATSNTGKQSPWTELDATDAHVKIVTIPGAPVGIIVEGTTEDPEITASLPSTHPGFITGMQALVTLLPQGRVQDTGMDPISGNLRTATVVYQGEPLTDGQRTSTVVRLMDGDGIVGRYSAPVEQTHYIPAAATGPEITTAPQRFLTLRPTFTIAASTFDGWRLRLLHETDDSIVLYDSGATVVVDQTSVNVQIPAGTLSYGQKFRAQAAIVPNGAGTTYGDYSDPKSYSIAGLPRSVLSVPDAVGGIVGDQTPTWRRVITDPDGGTVISSIIEVNVAASPPGTGDRLTKLVRSPGLGGSIADEAIPGLTIPWETSVDARTWTRNDITALAGTTLNGAVVAGATSITLTSTSGMVVGQRIIIYSGTTGRSEERAIVTLPGANVVTFLAPLEWAHLTGETVAAYVPGPFSPWITITAHQPPTVDLLAPADDAVVTRPWQELSWAVTGHGGATQASAVVELWDDSDEALVLWSTTTTDTEVDIPAFLLADAAAYEWSVTVTDTLGTSTTSPRRAFTTTFTEPDPVDAVSQIVVEGNVVLGWDEVTDTDLHHIEVAWQADDGEWVRIDGGPEELEDGLTSFTGSTLTHIGARLGVNAYSVRVHNGWKASEPTNVTMTLGWTDVARGSWELAGENGEVRSIRVSDASMSVAAMMDVQQAPGASPRAIAWGIGGATIPIRTTVVPLEDGSLTMWLRSRMADPVRSRPTRPFWVRPPSGYALDPVWCVLGSMTTTPSANGFVDVSMDCIQIGPPVHSILPPVPVVGDEEAMITLSESEYDWGEVEIP
jgi:hypothetical protein